ncbi:hypothetical protein F4861DRAFT_498706 [Xylaria intraflava]|nr:hypothetical protein F4861DRAFT_498706 [Xylaria intraflava]
MYTTDNIRVDVVGSSGLIDLFCGLVVVMSLCVCGIPCLWGFFTWDWLGRRPLAWLTYVDSVDCWTTYSGLEFCFGRGTRRLLGNLPSFGLCAVHVAYTILIQMVCVI